jgi:hypothetical protein
MPNPSLKLTRYGRHGKPGLTASQLPSRNSVQFKQVDGQRCQRKMARESGINYGINFLNISLFSMDCE